MRCQSNESSHQVIENGTPGLLRREHLLKMESTCVWWGRGGNDEPHIMVWGGHSHDRTCIQMGRVVPCYNGENGLWMGIWVPILNLHHTLVWPWASESWTQAECQRIDAFELWCWRRLLRVPWTAKRSNQSILKEISPEYSLEGLLLKLKLHYFGHLMQRVDSLEKALMLGKIEGRRRRGQQRMRWLDGITDSMDIV